MKLQLTPRFPAQVVGAGVVSVTKANGVVTIGLASEPTIIQVDGTIADKTGAIAIVKDNPALTQLLLPSVANQGGSPLRMFDWSTNVVNHQILITPFGAQTIKRLANYSFYSNAAELGSVTLYPSTALNGWYIG